MLIVSLDINVVATLLVGVVTFFARRHIAPEGGVFESRDQLRKELAGYSRSVMTSGP